MGKSCKQFLLILISISFIAFYQCNAPRNNPLDPKNPDNRYAVISGSIKTLSLPSKPLADAIVLWRPEERMVASDGSGKFTFTGILPQAGWLIVSKEGYLTDSTFINNFKSQVAAQFLLNEKPRLDSLTVYSVLSNRYPSLTTCRVVIKCILTDRDNDIDSVYVENPHLGIRKYLEFNVDERLYEKTWNLYDLNVQSGEQVVGYDFKVFVRDRFGHIISVGQDNVRRIIHDEVKFKSPSSYQVVSPTPRLEWNYFDPGFQFQFDVEVYTDEISPEKVWEKRGISADSTAATVDAPLSDNDYFWVIWCVDEFHNRSRSKPATFTVRSNVFSHAGAINIK